METTPYQSELKEGKFDIYSKCLEEAEIIAREKYEENKKSN